MEPEQEKASYILDERDQKAIKEVESQIDQLRSALADAAYDESMATAKRNRIVMEIEKCQNEGRRIIAEGAKAKGIDPKSPIEYDAKTYTIKVTS